MDLVKNANDIDKSLFYMGLELDDAGKKSVRSQMEKGVPAFSAPKTMEYGEEARTATIHIGAKESKPYYLRSVDYLISKPDNTVLQGLFKVTATLAYTSREMYNLLHGRSVYKQKTFFKADSPVPVKYYEWDTLNLKQKSDKGEHPVISTNNGFDIDKEVARLGENFFTNDRDKRDFIASLKKGDLEKREVVIDGARVTRWYTANPFASEIDVYRKDMEGNMINVSEQRRLAQSEAAKQDGPSVKNNEGKSATVAREHRPAKKPEEKKPVKAAGKGTGTSAKEKAAKAATQAPRRKTGKSVR